MSDRERTLLVVDAQNLYYEALDQFGPESRVDFEKLYKMVAGPSPEKLTAFVFMVNSAQRNSRDLISTLESIGFVVFTKMIRRVKAHGRKIETDWDVGLTIQTLKTVLPWPGRPEPDYGTVVLASGDGDLADLLQELRGLGIRTEVVSFRSCTSHLLVQAADKINFLDESVLWKGRRSNGGGARIAPQEAPAHGQESSDSHL